MLTSLVELRPFGVRLLPASWKADEDTVSSWVEAGAKDQAAFRDERPVVLSRVHGDLNKANVLLWVNKAHPFLIDFTTYQKEGHALQDFAHLEADIKFLLMDRDGEPGLKGLDHTAEQLPLWCEAETHLASEGWSLTKVPSSKMVKNVARRAAAKPNKEVDSAKPAGVKRGVGMIKTLRCAAQEVHRIGHGELSSDATFMAEYGMALLYHTLLVIRYKEISPFKRLLAVFSAARLIDLIPTLLGGYEHSSARV